MKWESYVAFLNGIVTLLRSIRSVTPFSVGAVCFAVYTRHYLQVLSFENYQVVKIQDKTGRKNL
jgi:hypothetical protein